MANEFKIGPITIILPDDLVVPKEVSEMSMEELRRGGSARKGLGLTCLLLADLLERYPDRLRLDPKYTPTYFRELGRRVDAWDTFLLAIEEAERTFKKANLFDDGQAIDALRDVNKQIKAQSDDDPALPQDFSPVRVYFGAKE